MKSKTIKIILLMALDAVGVIVSGALALLMRFDLSFSNIPQNYIEAFLHLLPWEILETWVIFFICHMYHYIWHNISFLEMGSMVLSTMLNYIAFHVPAWFLGPRLPRSVILMELLFQIIILTGIRCSIRVYQTISHWFIYKNRAADKRIMLIGAGQAGQMLLKEMMADEHGNNKVVCIIDDNEIKWGKYLESVRIIGGRDRIMETVERQLITDIIIAVPSLSGENRKDLLSLCKETGCRLHTLPSANQLLSGKVSVSSIREVRIEDLLGREPVSLNQSGAVGLLRDKVILVTGGGGSIGSELCRQIAGYHPKKLIIVDSYENNAYAIQQELWRQYGKRLDLTVEIASVRDKQRINTVFDRFRPQVVFHAAAHKHVPLMEDSPSEAIKNNIFGTYHLVCAAEKYGVEKFILVSTDKAVNPTNVMGATKRFCEMILQSRTSATEYCVVRFGNVLGSNGSVVPLFKEQIANGGPVTVTDRRITRFFMTIPEAVQLILEAGSIARQNQVFVLDMGEPVRIIDLAENLIRLSGLKPYQDIDIVETGLRPGEKLYEELLMNAERLTDTSHKKIFIEEQQPIDPKIILANLEVLEAAISDGRSEEELRSLLRQLIPTYQETEEVNAAAVLEKDGKSDPVPV